MGASAIIPRLTSNNEMPLVDLGVNLGMMKTVVVLQVGFEEAERLIGYRADGTSAPTEPRG